MSSDDAATGGPSTVTMETTARLRCMSSCCWCDCNLRAPALFHTVPTHPENSWCIGEDEARQIKKSSSRKWFSMFSWSPTSTPVVYVSGHPAAVLEGCTWRLVLLRASLLVLQEVGKLSSSGVGPGKILLRFCHTIRWTGCHISY